jgi:ribonuclease Z
VVFLGTGGSVPTPARSLPSVVVHRGSEVLMFDCGEGTQRQMIRAKTGFHKNMKIFVTHMHGDHMLGLPGVLQTMALLDRERKVEVFGPVGIRRFLECVGETVQFVLTFPVEVCEVMKPGLVCEEEEYVVEAVVSNHVVPSFAYALVEKPRAGRFYPKKAKALGIPKGILWSKLQHGESVRLPNGSIVKARQVVGPSRRGRKIVYTGDTRPFKELASMARDADLLIHDGTLDDDLAERAERDGHSTPSQAAACAKEACVKQLVLTHISARYDDTGGLLKHAKKIFRKSLIAEDFMSVELPLRE